MDQPVRSRCESHLLSPWYRRLSCSLDTPMQPHVSRDNTGSIPGGLAFKKRAPQSEVIAFHQAPDVTMSGIDMQRSLPLAMRCPVLTELLSLSQNTCTMAMPIKAVWYLRSHLPTSRLAMSCPDVRVSGPGGREFHTCDRSGAVLFCAGGVVWCGVLIVMLGAQSVLTWRRTRRCSAPRGTTWPSTFRSWTKTSGPRPTSRASSATTSSARRAALFKAPSCSTRRPRARLWAFSGCSGGKKGEPRIRFAVVTFVARCAKSCVDIRVLSCQDQVDAIRQEFEDARKKNLITDEDVKNMEYVLFQAAGQ
eukprot:411029-Rhodomonas_salina.5